MHNTSRGLTFLLTAAIGCSAPEYNSAAHNIMQIKSQQPTFKITDQKYLQAEVTLGTPEIENVPYLNESIPLLTLVTQYKQQHPGLTQPVLYIEKSNRTLTTYMCINPNIPSAISTPQNDPRCTALKVYPVSLGYNPVGDKQCRGDFKTPEGEFYITKIKQPGKSKFHAAMRISYPSPAQAIDGKQCNIKDSTGNQTTKFVTPAQVKQIKQAYENCTTPPADTPLGNEVQIHGAGGNPSDNWTWGCIAPSSDALDELLDPKINLIKTGCYFPQGKRIEKTKVIIVP